MNARVNWHGEKYRWEPYLREEHRTPYAWCPALVSGDGPPGGSRTLLEIGFSSEDDCQSYIEQVLDGR